MNLVPRFFDVSSGRILIDGIDVRDCTLQSLRRQLAIVTQDVILFDDTIWGNIAYGNPQAPRESILAAARAALVDDFVSVLPQKYETRIGERGLRLSGGERQRISIARAILKNAPILILDEATSSLDSESEVYVQRALAESDGRPHDDRYCASAVDRSPCGQDRCAGGWPGAGNRPARRSDCAARSLLEAAQYSGCGAVKR